MVKGTKTENVIKVLLIIPKDKRNKVKKVTQEKVGIKGLIIKRSFPQTTIVIVRFHMQKPETEAIKIKYLREVIEKKKKK